MAENFISEDAETPLEKIESLRNAALELLPALGKLKDILPKETLSELGQSLPPASMIQGRMCLQHQWFSLFHRHHDSSNMSLRLCSISPLSRYTTLEPHSLTRDLLCSCCNGTQLRTLPSGSCSTGPVILTGKIIS